MNNKFDEKLQKITCRYWLFILLLSQVVYFIMLSQTIPQIQQEANGMKVFDLQPFGYSSEYAYQFLSQLSSKGYDVYQFVQLPLDTIYPLLNCLTGIATFILLLRVYRKMNGRIIQQKYPRFAIMILLLPVTTMIFDYLENIMIFMMLSYKASIPEGLIMVSSTFTVIKSMTTILFYCMCLMMVAYIGVIWIMKKVKRMKTIG